jgi:hypothetical protein
MRFGDFAWLGHEWSEGTVILKKTDKILDIAATLSGFRGVSWTGRFILNRCAADNSIALGNPSDGSSVRCGRYPSQSDCDL